MVGFRTFSPSRNVLKIEISIQEWLQRQIAKEKLKYNQNEIIRKRMKCQRCEKEKEKHVISRPLTRTIFLKAVIIYTSLDARGYHYLVIEPKKRKKKNNKKQRLQPLFSYRFHSSICHLYREILIISVTEINCWVEKNNLVVCHALLISKHFTMNRKKHYGTLLSD